jgi:hypothetical protein
MLKVDHQANTNTEVYLYNAVHKTDKNPENMEKVLEH